MCEKLDTFDLLFNNVRYQSSIKEYPAYCLCRTTTGFFLLGRRDINPSGKEPIPFHTIYPLTLTLTLTPTLKQARYLRHTIILASIQM